MKFYILQVSKKFEIEEEKNEDTSGEEQEEKDPPLLYSQFGEFLFYLKKYYVLCKLFNNCEMNEEFEVSREDYFSKNMQEKLSDENMVDVENIIEQKFKDVYENEGKDSLSFETIVKILLQNMSFL